MPWITPDEGPQAWLVVLASFVTTGLCLGTINSFGVFYAELQSRLEANGAAWPSFSAALVGSLAVGMSLVAAPLSGAMVNSVGVRKTVLVGGLLAMNGIILASLTIHYIELMYLGFGLMFGLGCALAYSPCLTILGLYFEGRLGLVNRMVFASGSAFTLILPPTLQAATKAVGLEMTLTGLACLMILIILSALLFKTPEGASALLLESNSTNLRGTVSGNWSAKKYLIWAAIIPMALLAYYIPYFHLVKLSSMAFPEKNSTIFISCIGGASLVGRILYGKVSELLQINRIFFQQLSLIIIGISCILFGKFSNWDWLIMVSLVLGLFDGCLISQIEPVVSELSRIEGALAAKICFFCLGFAAVTAGPPLAGILYDQSHSYEMAFMMTGSVHIFSAVMLHLVHVVN